MKTNKGKNSNFKEKGRDESIIQLFQNISKPSQEVRSQSILKLLNYLNSQTVVDTLEKEVETQEEKIDTQERKIVTQKKKIDTQEEEFTGYKKYVIFSIRRLVAGLCNANDCQRQGSSAALR